MGRVAFNIGVLLLFLALIPLFFIRADSAEFIVDVFALVFICSFLLAVIWDVRRQAKRESLK